MFRTIVRTKDDKDGTSIQTYDIYTETAPSGPKLPTFDGYIGGFMAFIGLDDAGKYFALYVNWENFISVTVDNRS